MPEFQATILHVVHRAMLDLHRAPRKPEQTSTAGSLPSEERASSRLCSNSLLFLLFRRRRGHGGGAMRVIKHTICVPQRSRCFLCGMLSSIMISLLLLASSFLTISDSHDESFCLSTPKLLRYLSSCPPGLFLACMKGTPDSTVSSSANDLPP